jgi:carbon storage regulator CsrA
MLVLARRKDEFIQIGDNIRIMIVRASGVVRVGVEAPPEMQIVRGELQAPAEEPELEAV